MIDPEKVKKANKLEKFVKNPSLATFEEIQQLGDNLQQLTQAVKDIEIPMAPKAPDSMNVQIPGIETITLKGDKGDKGDQGDAGPAGEQGPQGPKGDNGGIGPAGEMGPQGEAGKDGQPIDPSGIANEVLKQIKLPDPLTGIQIRDVLANLQDEDRLDFGSLKGLEKFRDEVVNHSVTQARGLLYAGLLSNPASGGGSGVSAFIQLSDVPNSYSGQGGKALRVNAGATGLEFFTASGSGTVTSVASADASITVTNPTTTVDLKVIKATTGFTVTGGSFITSDSNSNATPQWRATDTTVNFDLYIGGGGTPNAQFGTTTNHPVLLIANSVEVARLLTSGAMSATGAFTAGGVITGTSISASTGDVFVSSARFIYFNSRTSFGSSADGILQITNFAGSAGISLDVTSTGVLKVRNLANSADGAITAGAGTFSGAINKITLTAPATGSTITIDDGFTLHVTGNVTALSGSSTGSNTGDQTITLTGNVTGSGTGSFATTIASSVALTGSPTTTTQTPGDNSTKIATTAYVDAAVQGTDAKDACKYGTTGALATVVYNNGTSGVGATLTAVGVGALSLDGSTPSVGDRILVKNQVSTFQNGIYVVTIVGTGATVFVLTRATDFDQTADIDIGDSVFVTNGTVNASTTWVQNGTQSPVIGTDPITFSQIAGPGAITSGNGITVTGLSIAIDTSVTVDKTTVQTLTNKTLTSPTLTTPALGVATATSINGLIITATAGTLTIANNASAALVTSGNFSLTLTSTATTVATFPSGTVTLVATTVTALSSLVSVGTITTGGLGTGATIGGVTMALGSDAVGDIYAATTSNVLSRIAAVAVGQVLISKGVTTLPAWSSSITLNNVILSNNAVTASSNAATVPVTSRLTTVTNSSAATLTITITTASAVDGQLVMVRVLDFSAVAQTITWVNTENSTVSVPTTSNGSTTLFLTVGFIFNGATSKWRCIASA